MTARRAAMVEVNCETDFVAKDDNFASFADAVGERVLASGRRRTWKTLLQQPLHEGEDTTIEMAREALVAKIGENMTVRRFVRHGHAPARIGAYRHGTRIGVLVDMEGGNAELAQGYRHAHCGHQSAVRVDADDVPAAKIEKEREIFRAQAAESGKPAEIVEKIVDGPDPQVLEEVTLVGQPFVKDPDTSVGKLVGQGGCQGDRLSPFRGGRRASRRRKTTSRPRSWPRRAAPDPAGAHGALRCAPPHHFCWWLTRR